MSYSVTGRAENLIKGMDTVMNEFQRLKLHKKTYVVFEFAQINPVVFRLVKSSGIDMSADLRATPSSEELVKTFEECKSILNPESLSIVAYDLGYYTKNNNYRSMVILISYVPESLDPRHKVALASNMSSILESLNITQHFHVDDLNDYSYEYFKAQCSLVQK